MEILTKPFGNMGSPPYTWGALNDKIKTAACDRDHPHIHGEHIVAGMMAGAVLGSPPYTWGAPTTMNGFLYFSRITPIYMGSTARNHTESTI